MSEPGEPRGVPWFRAFRATGSFLLGLPAPVVVVLVAAWMGGIWWISDRHIDLGLDPENELWPVISNLAHAPLFGGLTILVAALALRSSEATWPRIDPARGALTLVPVVAWAVLDEWHQSLVPGRDATWTDVLMDVLGAVLVLWVVAYLGAPGAQERGLRRRLLFGVGLCVLCAVLTTRP